MSNIAFSTPFIRSLTHTESSVSNAAVTEILAATSATEKRLIVFIQNKSTSANLFVIYNSTGTAGILVPPLSNTSIENYTGPVRVTTDSGTASTVHLAVASI
jgi:hypothetical protein